MIYDKIAALGLALPDAPAPVASYVPAVRTGNLIVVSGQIPFRDGALLSTGPVPTSATLEHAQDAAKQCVLNGLAVLQNALDDDLERIRRIVRIGVFVASTAGFTDQPRVADGASDLLVDLLGDAGRHARAAVGVIALPLDATVEVEMLVEVD